MNTLAKEIFKPKLFSDQHEKFEKEYPGFHQMIYDSMEEYKDKDVAGLINQIQLRDTEIEKLKGIISMMETQNFLNT